MTYSSPRSHRQIVVLTVPPLNRLPFARPQPGPPPPLTDEEKLGGYIIAYALSGK
jgi:hypothetical protein